MASKVSSSKKLILNGIFGVIKEMGDSVDDYQQWIRLTHYNESHIDGQNKRWSSPSLHVDIMPRYMEPSSTGVLCVGLSFWATKLTALTHFWPHEWLIWAKLGTQTQDYMSGSEVTKHMSFDHVTEQMLNEELTQFVGQIEQYNPQIIWKESLLIPKLDRTERQAVRAETASNSSKPPRIKECYSIQVLAFEPPHLQFKVVSDGMFSCRAFVNDLGTKLNTCAHVSRLHLNRMGTITPDMCLKKYELHVPQIREAIEKYGKLFKNDLKKFDDLKKQRRGVV